MPRTVHRRDGCRVDQTVPAGAPDHHGLSAAESLPASASARMRRAAWASVEWCGTSERPRARRNSAHSGRGRGRRLRLVGRKDQRLRAERPPLRHVPRFHGGFQQAERERAEQALRQSVATEKPPRLVLHLLRVVGGEMVGQARPRIADGLKVRLRGGAWVARLPPVGIDGMAGGAVHPPLKVTLKGRPQVVPQDRVEVLRSFAHRLPRPRQRVVKCAVHQCGPMLGFPEVPGAEAHHHLAPRLARDASAVAIYTTPT